MMSLTGMDYLTRSILELMSHPDFSQQALGAVDRIIKMTTEELETVFAYLTKEK